MLSIILHPIAVIITLLWYIMHAVLPPRFMNWVALKLPYCEDSYAPAGFWTIPPIVPPKDHTHPAGFFENVLTPFGLPSAIANVIIRKNCKLSGIVVKVEPYSNNTWGHQTFYLKLDDPGALSPLASQVCFSMGVKADDPITKSVIKVLVPYHANNPPPLNRRIMVYGSLVILFAHGYTGLLLRDWTES